MIIAKVKRIALSRIVARKIAMIYLLPANALMSQRVKIPSAVSSKMLFILKSPVLIRAVRKSFIPVTIWAADFILVAPLTGKILSVAAAISIHALVPACQLPQGIPMDAC